MTQQEASTPTANRDVAQAAAKIKANKMKFAKIALAKAVEAYKRKEARACGVLAGKALEIIKKLSAGDNDEIAKLRQQGEFWVKWALVQQGLIWKNNKHSGAIAAVSFSPDGKTIIFGTRRGFVVIYIYQSS